MVLSPEVRQQIFEMGQRIPRLSNRVIAKALGIHDTSVLKFRDMAPVKLSTETVKVAEPELYEAIRKALKKDSVYQHDLADKLDISPRRLQQAVEEMKAKGTMIEFRKLDGHYYMTPAFAAPAGKSEIQSAPQGEWSHVFGVTSDNHLCNKHSRLDVLNAAYDTFERMGIVTVYNSGNWVYGEARFNKTELIVRPGMDSQLDYMIDKWPVKKGIVTHYVAGSDHEGWWQEREGVEVGRYLQYRAEEQGRNDLKYLGYSEADVSLKHGAGEAIMRVVHPGGGSAYAFSYTDQKRVETYQGGEKPHVEIAGHYHKAVYSYPREVHCVQAACTCDQSLFMRKKRLSAHVGYWVIKIAQDLNGAITRFSPEFFPFFDETYYKKRF